SNFDLGPLTFLRATDQMVTAAAAITILFIASPSAQNFVLSDPQDTWIDSSFMPWIIVAFVIGMIPDVGLLNIYDRVKLKFFKRQKPDNPAPGKDLPPQGLHRHRHQCPARQPPAPINPTPPRCLRLPRSSSTISTFIACVRFASSSRKSSARVSACPIPRR